MTAILNPEVLAERARNLGAFNGIDLVFVTLDPATPPAHAVVDLEFHNDNGLAAMVTAVQNAVIAATDLFPMTGGTRIPAGDRTGEVQVTDVVAGPAANVLRLTVAPVGDYSTYTLSVTDPIVDPLFAKIGFKFRPGCFNLNCAPDWTPSPAPPIEPAIDYLAKDYASFKHVIWNAMRVRVPGWEPTSEANLDVVLGELIAAVGDEISDFQDRVATEGYFSEARKRVSLARHARLMDDHIHQGNQSSTHLVVTVDGDVDVAAGVGLWTGTAWTLPIAGIFLTAAEQRCFLALNQLELYTWGGVAGALEIGSEEADLALPEPMLDPTVEADAEALRDLLRDERVRNLVIEEKLNPDTGLETARDITARQLLRLLDGVDAADTVFDPLAARWLVRLRWRREDRLTRRYCFITRCPGQPSTEGVSAFHGNVILATHGRPHRTVFRPPGTILGVDDDQVFLATSERHYEVTRWGVLCPLPFGPLAYADTPTGGITPPVSTAEVTVSNGGGDVEWHERIDLILSQFDDEHFMVETDEVGRSVLRFPPPAETNTGNGRPLPEGAVVTCQYQVGQGDAGNVGADAIIGYDPAAAPGVTSVRNPFDVTNGLDPEPRDIVLRRAPVGYRARQLRAVTLADYVARAEELPQVGHAYARYAWTGSWRTVRVSIDAAGTTQIDEATRRAIHDHLDAVRLIGEDLEIRPARYVGLDIRMKLCADPAYWPEDLAAVLEIEFSDGYTPDGRRGLFHADEWTFGDPIWASQLIGRALSIAGVERVLLVSMRRLDAGPGNSPVTIALSPDDLPVVDTVKLEVATDEIIEVANDPSHLERGRIAFEILGGRR